MVLLVVLLTIRPRSLEFRDLGHSEHRPLNHLILEMDGPGFITVSSASTTVASDSSPLVPFSSTVVSLEVSSIEA